MKFTSVILGLSAVVAMAQAAAIPNVRVNEIDPSGLTPPVLGKRLLPLPDTTGTNVGGVDPSKVIPPLPLRKRLLPLPDTTGTNVG
ncbi:hypothetical protein BGZ65_001087, partial [Modicella reniformis]